ncbi:MAG: hypothetical protein HQK62_09235 [Desulfamplus sp.]|nr:hypothetical protein [Desulfamplus sp.]
MKKTLMITAISLFIAISLSTFSMAASDSHGTSHDMKAHDSKDSSHDMAGTEEMNINHSMSNGGNEAIHSSMVGNYHFNYELIDMREKMKGMKNMPEMKATHHMMLFIKSGIGKMPENTQVGYLVENPDGTIQKVMAMGMGDGFGGDVNFAEKGIYTIKIKAIAGEEKLMDMFKYEVK